MKLEIIKLDSGLTLLYQQVPDIASAAYSFSFGAGLSADPDGQIGAALALAECAGRQAGEYSQREFLEQFASNGISHSENARQDSYICQGSCLASQLPEALRLLGLIFVEPVISEEVLPNVVSGLKQNIFAALDNPMRLVAQEFNRLYFAAPFNRPSIGTAEGLDAVTVKDLDAIKANQFVSDGATLSIVSSLEASAVKEMIEGSKLSQNRVGGNTVPKWEVNTGTFSEHLDHDSEQTQIIFGFDAPSVKDSQYYIAKVLNGVLSGGMFGRLFWEVREKRGLCYSVYSAYRANAEYGRFICYAGTTNERAAETLDVMRSVMTDLTGSITEAELSRAKTDLLSGTVIARETSIAKTSSALNDWQNFGKVRSVEDITNAIQSVSVADLDKFAAEWKYAEHSLLTLGKERLDVN